MSSQIAKDSVWTKSVTDTMADRQTEVNINRDSSLHPDLPNFFFFLGGGGGVSCGGGGGRTNEDQSRKRKPGKYHIQRIFEIHTWTERTFKIGKNPGIKK